MAVAPYFKMSHILQPKHSILSAKDAQELLNKLNVSKAQLPKIFSTDPVLPENCQVGEIVKIERKTDKGVVIYYRVIV